MDEVPAPKPKPPAPKRKAADKIPHKVESDDDDNLKMLEKPPPMKTTKIPSDSGDEVAILPSKSKDKTREAQKQVYEF